MALILQTKEVDGQPLAITKDGKPLYIDDTNDKELTFDPEETAKTIRQRNHEAANHRQEKEKLAEQLKRFEGIEDPDAARQALETVANLDTAKLLDVGKVEEIKKGVEDAAKKKYEGELNNVKTLLDNTKKEADTLKTTLQRETIRNAFATSKYISEKLSLPAPAVQRIFEDHFKVEDGKIVAYDSDGHKLYSQEKPSESPGFDEAIGMIVSNYQFRDNILKSSGHQGGGGSGSGSNNGGGRNDRKKVMLRSEFERLSPAEKAKHMREGWKPVDTVEEMRAA
jgi:hypothetical protein